MRIFGFEIGRARADTPAVGAAGPRVRMMHALGHGHGARGFEAAKTDRLVAKFTKADETVNMALLNGLRLMRARSRSLARDNEYAKHFFRLVRINVVGHTGFTLKVNCLDDRGQRDDLDSARVARAYGRWAKPGVFEVTGKMSEPVFDALAVNMIARDGEVLLRFVEGTDRGIHGVQLQLLAGHLLDEEHNVDLANGYRIRMGIEFDPFMKPVAYHLRVQTGTADMYGSGTRRYERVPASEMLHLFMPEEVEQWRGIPWLHAGARDAYQLDTFDEAALVAAGVGASKMGFFKRDPDAAEVGDAPMGAPDGAGDFITEATPGEFSILPDGYSFEEWNPSYPSENYGPFTKTVQRRMAVGWGVSAHSLTGDLTDVNFSSIRSGTLDEREVWKFVQGWYAAICKKNVFEFWLSRAMLRDPELIGLPYAKFDKFNAPDFHGRRWDWVDPNSDMKANLSAVALGIESRAQLIRERGRDPEIVWSELATEEARGFTTPQPGQNAAPAQDTQPK